jgi:ABC-type protease/lipase transport system fused ATPase/permease subunit
VIAHRPSALVAVDLVAIVQNGRMTAFGKKNEIMTPGLQSTARPVAGELQAQVRRPA